jgi:hypothetical protein
MRGRVARSWSLTRLGFTDSEGWRSFNLAFRGAFRLLEMRIRFLAALPMEKLDRLAIQRSVEQIGRTT